MICNEFRFVVLLLFSIGKAFFFINNIVTLPKIQIQKKYGSCTIFKYVFKKGKVYEKVIQFIIDCHD